MNVVIGLGLQRAYFHPEGVRYLGERAEKLRVRLVEFFQRLPKDTVIFYTREIHQPNDIFYRGTKSYALVGTTDVEILEVFKPYPKFIINTSRCSGFFMTALESELHKTGVKTLTMVGVETHTNILFTAEELRNRDYEVIVPEALVTSEDDYMHAAGINILSNALSVHVE